MQNQNDRDEASSPPERTLVFISYSRNDKKYLDRLKVHLRQHVGASIVDYWDDTQIPNGTKWFPQIQQAIASAKVAILLISADFLADDFITTYELSPLLEAHRGGLLHIVPVILSTCRFSDHPELSRIQTVSSNPPTKPISKMRKDEQERAWTQITQQVERWHLS